MENAYLMLMCSGSVDRLVTAFTTLIFNNCVFCFYFYLAK